MNLGRRPEQSPPSNWKLFRLCVSHRGDLDQFLGAMARRSAQMLDLPLRGRTVVELGCGQGHDGEVLQDEGATMVSLDIAPALDETPDRAPRRIRADARRTPFRAASFDGVYSSNLLEHAPDPEFVFDEIERILRPGGWAWVSWTNWYSPWGGHDITPFHYFGPRLGLWLRRRLVGEPRRNVPMRGLFPTHVGTVLRMARARPGLRLVDARPRYYPSQRWILRVPGLRELITWNCVLVFQRVASPGERDRAA